MPDPKDRPAGEKKEKHAKTKPMPFDAVPDFNEWAQKQPRPTPDDKGKLPPEAPKDQKEPREHGAEKADEEAPK